MIDKLERIAKLRELLLRMEGELGLEGLTRFERDLLYAMRALSEGGKDVLSSELRRHALVEFMSQPTYHRALRALITRGFICSSDSQRGAYRMVLPSSSGGNQ